MGQIFNKSTNSIARASIIGSGALAVLAIYYLFLGLPRSSYWNQENTIKLQPVQFSHKHHVGDDGIDCRYCHTSVESSASAGMPPIKTCMNCHSQLFSTTNYLEPVRESYKSGIPIHWTRIYDLPDYVYFNHSIHIAKGVGCATCHGRVDQMPLITQVSSLQMEWCIQCHRAPEKYLRPRSQVFNMAYVPPANQEEVGLKLKKEYHVLGEDVLTSCSTCHR
ncbi:MAG TPA: cytochrome c3 family protein [Candidatus Kapabacteria bacterium]|nr:cytochrome c3 family protein [Candidatus Kapabacteria bacterium]